MIAILLAQAASATPIAVYDLEEDDGGFVEGGETGAWDWGVVQNGPGSGFDGLRAWSTGLDRDYLNDAVDYLEIPVPDLSVVARPTLSFQTWYDIVAGDTGRVEVNTGNGWFVVEPLYGYPDPAGFSGASGGWRTVVVDLTAYSPDPRVRLVFETDLGGVGAGWTIDAVAFHDGDVAAPNLYDLDLLADTDDLEGPYVVGVHAEDDTLVAGVTLSWSTDSDSGSAAMERVDATTWRGSIPAQLPDTVVSYWVNADDGLNESRSPAGGELSFRVYLPAPTGLEAPVGRVVATSVPLSWKAPVSRNGVVGYEVLRNGTVVASTEDTEVEVPLSGGADTFAVRALYEAGAGDLSDTVVVDGVVPTVRPLSPNSGWPGDHLRVRVSGEYLVLVEGEVTVDLGEGITVSDVEVRDVDDAWVTLDVADDATPGMRTLALGSGSLSVTAPDAFEVLSGADRPRLTGIEPGWVRQGDEGELVIEAVGELADTPTVDLGEGVSVRDVQVEDGLVRLCYAVSTDAPLGQHAVTVDDGVRVLSGMSLDVKDELPKRATGCSAGGAPSGTLAALGLALLLRARSVAPRGRRR